jgi:zona occludens toxin
MALNLYTGQPGSGKSYSVVAHVIIPALKKDRHVVTNIPLDEETLVQVYGGQITQLPLDALEDPDLPDRIPPGCVAVIDECWNRWPSGQRVAKAANGDLHWLKEHRHRVDTAGNAMQVVLVTQDPSDLASWVRKLIKHTFWMEKLDTVGADNRFSIKIYKGCPTGENIPKRYLIRQSYGSYEPDIYQYYQSATQSESFSVGDEKAMDRRTSIWKSPGFIAQMTISPAIFCIAIGVLYWSMTSATKEDEPELVEQVETAPEPVQIDVPALTNPLPPSMIVSAPEVVTVNPEPDVVEVAKLRASATWRVAGYIVRSDEPRTAEWDSREGYGDPYPVKGNLQLAKNFVILSSMSGMRYVPQDDCQPYADGINWSCDIDGERVTPWSGQMGISDTIPAASVSGARRVSVERSETESASPEPRTVRIPEVTVISDNSRMQRTLLSDTN